MAFGMEAEARRETLTRHGRTFNVYLLEAKNAVVCFFFEGDFKLGTIAFALPRGLQPSGHGISNLLLGHRNANITRILAEYLASTYGKLSLVSVFLPEEGDLEGEKSLLELAKILKKPPKPPFV